MERYNMRRLGATRSSNDVLEFGAFTGVIESVPSRIRSEAPLGDDDGDLSRHGYQSEQVAYHERNGLAGTARSMSRSPV
jgi:hypothetical protein